DSWFFYHRTDGIYDHGVRARRIRVGRISSGRTRAVQGHGVPELRQRDSQSTAGTGAAAHNGYDNERGGILPAHLVHRVSDHLAHSVGDSADGPRHFAYSDPRIARHGHLPLLQLGDFLASYSDTHSFARDRVMESVGSDARDVAICRVYIFICGRALYRISLPR